MEGLILFVMCLYIKGQFLINFLPLHTFVFEKVISEADLSAVNLFTWKLFIGWVTDVLLVWLNLFSFYLWFCFLLQFLIFFFLFELCFTLVVCFWRDRECTCTRFNLSIAFLCSQIYKKLVDLTHFSCQFNG